MTQDEESRAPAWSWGMRPEVFANWCLLLVAGIAIALITPPLHSPDEPFRFFRASAVSEGHFVPQRRGAEAGSVLPCDLLAFRKAMLEGIAESSDTKMPEGRIGEWRDVGRPSQRPERCFVPYSTDSVYTPITYLVSAAAIRAARLADASFVEQVYVVRIANLVLSWLLTGVAIRLAPSAAWSMLALSALPMAAFLRATHMSDSVATALALVVVALLVRSLGTGAPVPAAGVAAAALFGLTKPLYLIPVSFLAVVPGTIPWRARRRLVSFAALAATAAIGLMFSHAGYIPGATAPPGSPWAAAGALVTSPVATLSLCVRDLVSNADVYRMGFVGVLGWLDAPVPRSTSFALLAGLLVIIVLESQQIAVPRWVRLAVVLAAAASILSLQLATYLSWTPAGATRIIGVQGRYFLPLAPLLLLVVPRVATPRPSLARIAGLCFVPFALAVTLAVLFMRYWA